MSLKVETTELLCVSNCNRSVITLSFTIARVKDINNIQVQTLDCWKEQCLMTFSNQMATKAAVVGMWLRAAFDWEDPSRMGHSPNHRPG
jgi:hypothetical protein